MGEVWGEKGKQTFFVILKVHQREKEKEKKKVMPEWRFSSNKTSQ